MNQVETIMRDYLDGNLWSICLETGNVLHKTVPKDFVPNHFRFDYSAAGKRARRNNAFTHRNPKREIQDGEYDLIKRMLPSFTSIDALAQELRERGHRASRRAIAIAVRRIRSSNG